MSKIISAAHVHVGFDPAVREAARAFFAEHYATERDALLALLRQSDAPPVVKTWHILRDNAARFPARLRNADGSLRDADALAEAAREAVRAAIAANDLAREFIRFPHEGDKRFHVQIALPWRLPDAATATPELYLPVHRGKDWTGRWVLCVDTVLMPVLWHYNALLCDRLLAAFGPKEVA